MKPETRQPHLQVNLRAKSKAQPSATAPHSSSGRRRAMSEAPRNPRRSRPSEEAATPGGLREPEPLRPPPPPSSSASSLLLLPPPTPRPPHSDITCSPLPALYCRGRRLGPGGPAPHVAPGPRRQRRPLTRTLHVSDTSKTPRPPSQSLRECTLPPIPESHAPGATPPGIRSLRGCSQHSRPRHPFADPAPLVRTAQSSSHSNSAPPSSGDCAGAAASFPEASWCCVLEGVRFVSPFVYCCCASLPRFRGRDCP